MGMSFSGVMTGLGIVACTGIVVNNNIILIDSYRKIRKVEKDKEIAIIKSARSRIRPIFLTTITTVCGLLPSALQISMNIFDRSITYKSPETYFVQPLAWAIVWGLSFCKFTTAGNIPYLHTILIFNLFCPRNRIQICLLLSTKCHNFLSS